MNGGTCSGRAFGMQGVKEDANCEDEKDEIRKRQMEYSKLQMGCLLVVLYVTFIYVRERQIYEVKKREVIFEALLAVGITEIVFDGVTAYTVNHLLQVPDRINRLLHIGFLCSLDAIVFLMFLYILDITRGVPESGKHRICLGIPLVLNIAVVVIFIHRLEFRSGEITNYSMGISAYTCFVMVAIYMLMTFFLLFTHWKNLGQHKVITVSTYVAVSCVVAIYQMLQPQALISSLVPTLAIVGTYLNMENPVFTKLQNYNNEMVMGFATLVENRDDNTGGHIKRTTEYVRMLAQELRRRGYYKEELTKAYMDHLVMAAPMHDVGKIAIPDAILQKPGRLTAEEFEIMKTHAERGGRIIKETFGHMQEDEYQKIAYEVARFHHEKWNGKGYPEGLAERQIPLCARIMAVADVFDAVSAKRCYRDAMPLAECFAIIEKGSGEDFDPVIANVFLNMREKIEALV